MARPKSLRNANSFTRSLGVLSSLLDPRTYLHVVKLLHFANYSHASQVSKIHKGEGVRIAPNVSFSNAEYIHIGSHARIAEHAIVWAAEDGAQIEIGEHAVISPYTMVTAAKYDFERGPQDNYAYRRPHGKKIVIGRGVVIYSSCIVLAGSDIGEGAIIGPGSLVNGKIPPFAIALGNPARVVMQRESPLGASGGD